MSDGLEDFQYLLQGLRSAFLDDLQERCDKCDNLLLGLEKNPQDRQLFDELYREVHSLKGSGGTNGLHVITSICHQLENSLMDMVSKPDGSRFLELCLKYVDLLRRVEAPGRLEIPDFSAIEAELERLRQSALQSRKSCLVAESSAMMANVYQAALEGQDIQCIKVSNGLEALSRLLHESYDLAIIGRELQDLNGLALLAALRLSKARNHQLPVILVTSNPEQIPDVAQINIVLTKDSRLPANLAAALKQLRS